MSCKRLNCVLPAGPSCVVLLSSYLRLEAGAGQMANPRENATRATGTTMTHGDHEPHNTITYTWPWRGKVRAEVHV